MRSVEFHINYKKVVRSVPEKWDDLTEEQLLFFCRKQEKFMKMNLSDEKKTRIFRRSLAYYFMNVHPALFFEMNAGQLWEAMKLQDFLFDACDLTRFLIKRITFPLGLRTYYSPGDSLKWSTVGEVAYADSSLQAYQLSGKDEDLCMLLASLYRPTNPVRLIGHILFGNDIRCKFNDNVLKRRAKKFAKLPAHLKMAILYQYKGCREVDIRNNPEIYDSKGEPSQFGWAGLIKGLANSDIAKTEIAENMLWSNAQLFLKMLEHDRVELQKLYEK